jgi:hypothetical protein
MHAKAVARVLLTLGFAAASIAYGSWIAQRTILDPSATGRAAHALLATKTVHASLASEIRSALAPSLGRAADDPRVATAIDRAIADPRLVGAFEDAIVDVHRHILSDGGGGAGVSLHSGAVMSAIDDAFAHVAPDIAAKVHAAKPVKISMGGSQLPHVGNAARRVNTIGAAALAAALALIAGALLLARDRGTIRRAGRRLAMLAIPATLVFVVAPYVLHATSTSTPSTVVAAVLGAYAGRVVPSAVLLATVGILTWLLAIVAPAALALPAVESRRARSPLPSSEPSSRPAPARLPVRPAPVGTTAARPAARAADELYL